MPNCGKRRANSTSINVYKPDDTGREIDIYSGSVLDRGAGWLWLEATLLRLLRVFLEHGNVLLGESTLVRTNQHA